MEKAGGRRVFKPRVETKLSREDFRRVSDLAVLDEKTKSEVVRDAVLFYLKVREDQRNAPRETEIALAIKEMTNRITAMLARQGDYIATIHEMTYQTLSDEGRRIFEVAAHTAKQKMRRHLERDEREVAEKMRKVLNP